MIKGRFILKVDDKTEAKMTFVFAECQIIIRPH
jgi:hypothetical protein